MLGETRLCAALALMVKRARADGASVCAHARSRQVFRFANEAIHQDLVQEGVTVTVKILEGRRVGVSSADTLEPQSLARCAAAARDIARHSPAQRDPAELPRGYRMATTADVVPATVHTSPAAIVSSIKRLVHLAKGAGAALAGSAVTGADEFAVVNSSGVACYAASTVAGAKLVTMYRRLSGYAGGVDRSIKRLDLEGLLKRSLQQSLRRQEPVAVPLGSYEVILEPEAVAELVSWLGYTAFGAKSVEERTSCLAGRMGDRVMSEAITIYDDGNDPAALRMPFDFEGTPKRRVTLIDRGIAAGIVYDAAYGARFGQASTGHGLPPDQIDGPLPLHLGMAPGSATVEEMTAACARGLLIPRFHYVNGLLNPREALMTGLTREGAFLIERGKITTPVKTLRFTQSLLEACRRVIGVSRARRLVADPSQELGCAVMPALHLAEFKFTGRSES